MDKGDLGTIVGAIAGGALVVASGVGAPWLIPAVIGGSAVGAYAGHEITSSHYLPQYQYK